MNKTLTLVFTAVFALTLVASAFGQNPDPLHSAATAAPGTPIAAMQAATQADSPSATCSYLFTLPATATKQFLQYCISPDGNIVQFESPAGVEHIAAGTNGEGYSVCDFASGLGYRDYGDYGEADTGAWGAPVLLNLTASLVKIARTTTDGVWTLTQTFTKTTADSTVKVTMALKNNTAIDRFVWLARFADIDAASTFSNILDGSFNMAYGISTSAVGTGMQLTTNANPYAHYGFAVPTINAACSIGSGWAGTMNGADGVVHFYYGITVKKGATATVSFKYKGI